MARATPRGVTLPQLAVFTDWAEQRLLMLNVEAQLEKVMLLVLDDPPVARAVQEAKDMLSQRSTVRERLQDPESLLKDPDSVVPEWTAPGPSIAELPAAYYARPTRPVPEPASAPEPVEAPPVVEAPAAPAAAQLSAIPAAWYAVPAAPVLDSPVTPPAPPKPKRHVSRRISLEEPTERELSILQVLADGRSNQDIADALQIGAQTVKTHIGRMIARYKTGDRAGLAVMALRKGWIV